MPISRRPLARQGEKSCALIERLEERRLFSVPILFSGVWTGTYQLDAQSTANAADPHYTGGGTIVVKLTNSVGTATLSGLTGASVTRSSGSTTETVQATVTSNSGTAAIGDTGNGILGAFAASGQLVDDIVTDVPNGPPIHSHIANPDPLAFPFTGSFANGVISGAFESSVYQSGHFTLTGGSWTSGGGTGGGGGGGGGTGGGTPKTPGPAALPVYNKAVALAEKSPGLDYGGKTAEEKTAVLIQKHEGTVLFVYPDRNGNPTVGVGFNLNLKQNPAARQTIDDLFGAGAYDKMMASFNRTEDAWKKEHHDSLAGFQYGSPEWKKFFKEHGGTLDKGANLASGSDAGDVLTNVLTRNDVSSGTAGTAAQLFETVLPQYIADAKAAVGTTVFDELDPTTQAALTDIVYNRGLGNTKAEFSEMIAALKNGDDLAAARALMDARLSTGKSNGKPWATLDQVRAIDDFRYIVAGLESELPHHSGKKAR